MVGLGGGAEVRGGTPRLSELVQMEAKVPSFEKLEWKTSKLLPIQEHTILYFQFITL